MSRRIFPFVVTLFALTPHRSDASIMDGLEFDHSAQLAELTVRLLENCLLKNDNTVALAGDANEFLVRDLHLSKATTIATVGHSRTNAAESYSVSLHRRKMFHSSRLFRFRHKLTNSIVAAPSQPILRLMLEKLKNSVWWNSYGSFIIMEKSSRIGGCKKAYSFLWTAWKLGLLSSLFLCVDADGQSTMYSYNPYLESAPKPWKKVGQFRGRNGHPWTLFERRFIDGHVTCDNVIFEKTRQLNGYPIHVNAVELQPTLFFVSNRTGIERYSGVDGVLMQSLWRKLNATVVEVSDEKGEHPLGFADRDGTFRGAIICDISSGKVDIGLNSRYVLDDWKIGLTYSHHSSGVCYLTKRRGMMTKWTKFSKFLGAPVSLGLLVMLSVSVIVLRYSEKRGYFWAFLNVLRMTLSSSLVRPPKFHTVRIFLCTVILLVFVINAKFQGQLVSFLTKHVENPNIDTLESLKESGYIINGYPPLKHFLTDEELRARFNTGEHHTQSQCIERVLEDAPVACLGDCPNIIFSAMENGNLHVSKQELLRYYLSYATTLDWPLLERVDLMIQRLVQAGMMEYWEESFLRDIERSHWAEMRATSPPNFKVLSTADLVFAFYALLFGLTCSTFAFFVERIIEQVEYHSPLHSHRKPCEIVW